MDEKASVEKELENEPATQLIHRTPKDPEVSPLKVDQDTTYSDDEQLSSPRDDDGSGDDKPKEKLKLMGKTAKGDTFYLPKTKNPLTMHPIKEWTVFEWVKNMSALNLVLVLLPIPRWIFIFIFIFWRFGYNLGLGYLLYRQSTDQWMTRTLEKWTADKDNKALIGRLLRFGMGPDYSPDNFPVEFNSWIGFRYLVDVILANDLMSYFAFCLAYWELPEQWTISIILAYFIGFLLCIFTLWAKTDAYRVVKDFAWYWGDFFFLVEQKLTFDRVFSISPHPMYIIGYSFFYGASLITQSYTVLYVSLFAHFCQIAFLAYVENPHIEKTYPDMVEDPNSIKNQLLQHYFRKDLIVFKNLDVFRASDLFLLVILIYCGLLNLMNLHRYFYLGHAIFWRLVHSLGLGYVLHLQSSKHWWTNHFVSLGYSKEFAFDNWKKIYNFSLVMTHFIFFSCAVKYTSFDLDALDGRTLLKYTAGLILLMINLWSSVSVFEVLGEFGWMYGDFFIDEVPSKLYYTGIYRFVNNPDNTTGFAGYYGLALMSDSWVIFALALFSQAAHSIFVGYVERVHMKKLYGNKVRSKNGITQAISEIVNEAVEKNPRLAEIKAKAEKARDKFKPVAERIKENLVPGGRLPC